MGSGGSLVAAVLLLTVMFLAHGLQCAAASDHGPGAMSHNLTSPASADDVMNEGTLGHESEVMMLVAPVDVPVGTLVADGGLGRASIVCVAVLTAMGIWFLSRGRAPLFGGRARVWPAVGRTFLLRTAARWRPRSLDLAVLCVLRT